MEPHLISAVFIFMPFVPKNLYPFAPMAFIPYLYPLILLTAACTIICLIIFLLLSTQLICACSDPCEMNDIDAPNPIKSVQYLSILSLLSFTICAGSQLLIIESLDRDLNLPDNSYYEEIICSINTFSWAFAQSLVYLLFITNLHHTFKNTSLFISKSMLIFLFTLVIIFFILNITWMILFLLYYNATIHQYNFGWLATVIVSVTELIDLIVSIILVYIFVNRLFMLFVINNEQSIVYRQNKNKSIPYSIQKIENDSWNSSLISDKLTPNAQNSLTCIAEDDEKSIAKRSESLNIQQKSIVYTASKYTILTSIAIVSTQLYLISGVNNGIAVMRYNASKLYYNDSFRIYVALLTIDCCINSLCVCLNFEFSKTWYNSLCFLCNSCCNVICIKISKKWYYKNKKIKG
eukprot:35621_1